MECSSHARTALDVFEDAHDPGAYADPALPDAKNRWANLADLLTDAMHLFAEIEPDEDPVLTAYTAFDAAADHFRSEVEVE